MDLHVLSEFSQLVRFLKENLATIAFRALQPQEGRIPCPVDRNLEIFLTSHIDLLFVFEQSGDNCKLNLFLKRKVGVTERPKIVKSNQSYRNSHLPHHCSF